MSIKYLFPSHYQKIGWLLFIPAFFLGVYTVITDWEPDIFNVSTFALVNDAFWEGSSAFTIVKNNILNEILGITAIVGGIFIAFSKQEIEDEFISKIRLESLVWATYATYGFLLLSFLFVYGMTFFYVLILNIFVLLIFFIIRFKWQLSKINKTATL